MLLGRLPHDLVGFVLDNLLDVRSQWLRFHMPDAPIPSPCRALTLDQLAGQPPQISLRVFVCAKQLIDHLDNTGYNYGLFFQQHLRIGFALILRSHA
jgi:hypothetical protein